jgi:hypothetical protein
MLTSYFTEVYSGIMDFTLALIPWKLLWGLPIQKKEKFGAAVAMSMGVLYVIPARSLIALEGILTCISAGITSLVKAYMISILATDICKCIYT